jgi:CoA:oxalate CoA-transferase
VVGPLEGVRVLDMTRYVAGPYCTMLLADHGAEVIKIEPIGGEETRAITPKVGSGEGVSVYFARFNRNKQSICVNLKSEQGRRVMQDLVGVSDVLVENFRVGVMERFGFTWPELKKINDRLIYCSITGFGHTPGSYRERPAFAPVVESMAGLTRFNPPRGYPPLTIGISIGDYFPGAHALSAIMMALLSREKTGIGSRLDIAMYDAMLSLNTKALLFGAALGEDLRPGAPFTRAAPSGIYQAKDGYVCFSVVGETMWARFCRAIGREEFLTDPRLASGPDRAKQEPLIGPAIDGWLRERTRAQVVAELLFAGVPAGEVRLADEVVADEHMLSRKMMLQIPTYAGVDAYAPASPIRMGGSNPRRADEIPAAGRHTTHILRDVLGYSAREASKLFAEGAVSEEKGDPDDTVISKETEDGVDTCRQ